MIQHGEQAGPIETLRDRDRRRLIVERGIDPGREAGLRALLQRDDFAIGILTCQSDPGQQNLKRHHGAEGEESDFHRAGLTYSTAFVIRV